MGARALRLLTVRGGEISCTGWVSVSWGVACTGWVSGSCGVGCTGGILCAYLLSLTLPSRFWTLLLWPMPLLFWPYLLGGRPGPLFFPFVFGFCCFVSVLMSGGEGEDEDEANIFFGGMLFKRRKQRDALTGKPREMRQQEGGSRIAQSAIALS